MAAARSERRLLNFDAQLPSGWPVATLAASAFPLVLTGVLLVFVRRGVKYMRHSHAKLRSVADPSGALPDARLTREFVRDMSFLAERALLCPDPTTSGQHLAVALPKPSLPCR